MPYIIGFVSQKGGVGKSTLARAAAVSLAGEGYRVRLCDLDIQQGTVLEWYRRRLQGGAKPLASVEYYQTIAHALKSGLDVNPSFDIIVIDAPGRSSEATLSLARSAHLVIQPTSGTLDDLDPGIRLFHELRNKQLSPQKMVFALTRTTSDREEEMAREYIGQAGYIVFTSTLPDRAGYKTAQNSGLTVLETPYPSLNQRAESLLKEMTDYINLMYTEK